MATFTLDDQDNVFSGTGESDIIDAGGGNDDIHGLSGDDAILGRTGDDFLFGESGNDGLFGDLGNDHLIGGSGNDGLYGFSGNDHLEGNEGSDRLIGDTDNDVLAGGDDADNFDFIFAGGFEGISSAFFQGDDIISDFELGVDHIRVAGVTTGLDTNRNGQLDDGDARVDLDPNGLDINFTDVALSNGATALGTLTVLGVEHLTVGTDIIFV